MEPCPYCNRRINPARYGEFKKCPACGGEWYESGGGATPLTPACVG